MVDPVSQALAYASAHSVLAMPATFLAGIVSSVGPCAAPRFIALAGITGEQSVRRTAAIGGAFVAGLLAVYASFGALSSLIAHVVRLSPYTYAALAITLGAGACVTLWRDHAECSHPREPGESGIGAALLLGASSALVISPCCTPLLGAILAYTSASAGAAYASALLASFALGHALPVVAAGLGMSGIGRLFARPGMQQGWSVVGASLMLALSGYYAVLA